MLQAFACPQSISFSVNCKWFQWSVLPQDKALETEIFHSSDAKRCAVCGTAFVPKSISLIKRVSLEGLKRGESCVYPGYVKKEPPPCILLNFNVNEQIIENLSVIDNLVLQKPGNFVKYGFIHKQRLSALGEDFCDWCRERNISYGFVNNKNCYNLTDFEKMSVYLFKYHLSRKPIIFITDPLVYFDIDMVGLVFGEIRRWQVTGTTICIFVSEIRKTYSFASRILSVDHRGNISEHD